MTKKKESKELSKVEPSRVPAPFEEMERLVEDVFRRPFSLLSPSWFPRLKMPAMEEVSPSVDIYEDGDDVVVKSELPGFEKDNIDISLTDDSMTISGEKKKEDKVEKKNYYRLERSYGSFSRSFRLPAEVQSDKAKAKFKNGVLEVRVPKTEEAKKREKKVKVE